MRCFRLAANKIEHALTWRIALWTLFSLCFHQQLNFITSHRAYLHISATLLHAQSENNRNQHHTKVLCSQRCSRGTYARAPLSRHDPSPQELAVCAVFVSRHRSNHASVCSFTCKRVKWWQLGIEQKRAGERGVAKRRVYGETSVHSTDSVRKKQ